MSNSSSRSASFSTASLAAARRAASRSPDGIRKIPRSAPRSPEFEALQKRIADAVQRQHKLCAAKQACEAELTRLMRDRRGDSEDAKLAGLCDDKLEQVRTLAADAESAAAEIGRASGDLLMFQLRSGAGARRPDGAI